MEHMEGIKLSSDCLVDANKISDRPHSFLALANKHSIDESPVYFY